MLALFAGHAWVQFAEAVTATQIDFIWGILFAQCQKPAERGAACASYPAAPTIYPPADAFPLQAIRPPLQDFIKK